VHKNAAVLMIVILGCSEIDTKVSNVDIEPMGSDDCREMSEADGDTNSMLIMM